MIGSDYMKEISCPCCGQYIDVTEVYQDGWNDCMNDDGVPAQLLDMGYAKGRADREKEICDFLKALIESDYSSKECKLLNSDLLEMLKEKK